MHFHDMLTNTDNGDTLPTNRPFELLRSQISVFEKRTLQEI
jgi:hypothetical protein